MDFRGLPLFNAMTEDRHDELAAMDHFNFVSLSSINSVA